MESAAQAHLGGALAWVGSQVLWIEYELKGEMLAVLNRIFRSRARASGSGSSVRASERAPFV